MNDYQPLISFECLIELPTGGQSHFFLNKAQPVERKYIIKSTSNIGFETFFIRCPKDRKNSIGYRVSSIEYQVSGIGYRVGELLFCT